ncbi:histidinol-phosphate transaminase [Mesobacillus zeae]|uniref:Histidinol-phosphate aminotransferase n=1 Tax=Mesobacillus zeae TaxID=1917180 RepID=A0A398AYC1_9BACI|nr:histidinol-phosphate transaminase [Mesobacillus zeae]RID82575.1 histidinol-phosphate transaminase [Mesobacillus zeae]
MKWKKQMRGLKPYQPGRSIAEVKKEYGLETIIKLASNENPFGCSPKVSSALKNAGTPLALYPDGYATLLREAVAGSLSLEGDELIFGNGSDELIQMISRSLLHSGTNTVMADPTFPQYRHNAHIEGCEIREVPLVDGAHDLSGMLDAVDGETAVVWLCSPNNPTGVYITEGELLAFLDKVPKDVLVVLDEAYYEYVVADDYYNSPSLIREYQNLIVLRTFSKIYGLASLRAGYGFADREIIRALEPAREPFNMNSFAQAAALEAIKDQDFVKNTRKANREGMKQFYRFCEENRLSCYPSQGNFILIDFEHDGNEVFQFLLERGFIVRSGAVLGFPTCVRITVGTSEQNSSVIGKMKEFLAAAAQLS